MTALLHSSPPGRGGAPPSSSSLQKKSSSSRNSMFRAPLLRLLVAASILVPACALQPYEAVFFAFEDCFMGLPFAQPKLRRFEHGLSESSIQYRYGGQEQKMGVEKMVRLLVDDLQTPVYVIPFEKYSRGEEVPFFEQHLRTWNRHRPVREKGFEQVEVLAGGAGASDRGGASASPMVAEEPAVVAITKHLERKWNDDLGLRNQVLRTRTPAPPPTTSEEVQFLGKSSKPASSPSSFDPPISSARFLYVDSSTRNVDAVRAAFPRADVLHTPTSRNIFNKNAGTAEELGTTEELLPLRSSVRKAIISLVGGMQIDSYIKDRAFGEGAMSRDRVVPTGSDGYADGFRPHTFLPSALVLAEDPDVRARISELVTFGEVVMRREDLFGASRTGGAGAAEPEADHEDPEDDYPLQCPVAGDGDFLGCGPTVAAADGGDHAGPLLGGGAELISSAEEMSHGAENDGALAQDTHRTRWGVRAKRENAARAAAEGYPAGGAGSHRPPK